ncbi:MAG: hypothetical protein ACK2UL_04440 [Anaerolineae bacterium]
MAPAPDQPNHRRMPAAVGSLARFGAVVALAAATALPPLATAGCSDRPDNADGTSAASDSGAGGDGSAQGRGALGHGAVGDAGDGGLSGQYGSLAATPVEIDPERAYTEVPGTVSAGGAAHHVVRGEAGQVMLVSFGRRPSGTVSLTVRGPDGAVLADAVPEAVLQLPTDGSYLLTVNGAVDTDYTLYVTMSTGSTLQSPERISLETAATIDGTAKRGEVRQYRVSIPDGRVLSVQVVSPTGRYLVAARSAGAPASVWLSFAESAFTGNAEIERVVPTAGDHIISLLALGADDPTAVTEYELRLALTEPR